MKACPVCGGIYGHLWNCSLNQPYRPARVVTSESMNRDGRG